MKGTNILLAYCTSAAISCAGMVADGLVHKNSLEYGHELRESEFLLNYTNMNHGSFGACPKRVLEYQSLLRVQQEQQPDPWMRSKYREMLNETRMEIAQYLHIPNADELVLLESASTAVNSILRSVNWENGDILLYFSVAYAMVKNTAIWLRDQYGIEILEVPVQFPIEVGQEKEAFLSPMEMMLKKVQRDGKLDRLRVVVIDHIASLPAIRLPLLELATLSKQYAPNTFVFVDGAHSMGQIPDLDVGSLGTIDGYVSNGHKWLYSPKGSAILWVNSSKITNTFPEPTVISSANFVARDTSFPQRFSYTSTRDYTALLSLSEALRFRREQLGGDVGVYAYTRGLARDARRHLEHVWNTDSLVPEVMEDFMINVPLPTQNFTTASNLQLFLLEEHGIYIVVAQEPSSGILFTRLSAQVYLELKDFTRLAALVQEFIQRIEFNAYSGVQKLEVEAQQAM